MPQFRIIQLHTFVGVQRRRSFWHWSWWSDVILRSEEWAGTNFGTMEKAQAYIDEQLAWEKPLVITPYPPTHE